MAISGKGSQAQFYYSFEKRVLLRQWGSEFWSNEEGMELCCHPNKSETPRKRLQHRPQSTGGTQQFAVITKIVFEVDHQILEGFFRLPSSRNRRAWMYGGVICWGTVWKWWRWQWKGLWTSLFSDVRSEATRRAPFWQCLLSARSTNKLARSPGNRKRGDDIL